VARLAALAAALAVALAVSGCGGRALQWDAPPAGHYTVRAGDTLYSIAFRYGLDHSDLARWNGLGDGSLIHPGKVLRLAPAAQPAPSGGAVASSAKPAARAPAPATSPAKPADPVPAWQWPTRGPIVETFAAGTQVHRSGILISGQRGQPVVAAAAGQVVYSGSGLKGYGKLIIIQHNETYLTAYGHNSALLVAEGDNVERGERIASMGETPGRLPRLHFEIRRRGDPIDPVPFLRQAERR
jgi:lipoprotein NlpD